MLGVLEGKMKLRAGYAVLGCAIAALALADDIRFDPPNPRPHTSIVAVMQGDWPFSYCGPEVRSVTTEGSTITIHLATSQERVFCPSWNQARVPLGIRPAGIYTVVMNLDDVERVRAQLTVRDDETLRIDPYAVPMSGGVTYIRNPFYPDDPEVTIAGVKVENSGGPVLLMGAPAHAPGAVDVTVSHGTDTITARAALIYYDPATADPAVFEPVLFPVSIDGPGAFFSRWTTVNTLERHPHRFRDWEPCAFCVHPERLTNTQKPWGHLLYVMRGTMDEAILRSFIHEKSRQPESAGTPVPVVRDGDFRETAMRFRMRPPSSGQWRSMIRVWTLTDPGGQYFLVAYPAGTVPLPMTKIPNAEMWFGSIDVTPFMPSNTHFEVESHGFVRKQRWWGMLSITNNQTQQVVIEPAW